MPMIATTGKSSSIKAIAKLQDRDIERVTRRSGVLASRLWRAAKSMAERGELDETPVVDELADLMAYAYLLRTKLSSRRRRLVKSNTISLAESTRTLARRVSDVIDIDLGNVRTRFEPLAKRGVQAAIKDIRESINSSLAQAHRRDLTNKQTVAYVKARLRKHGVSPRSTAYVETLVRTHAAISYGVAHRRSFAGDTDLWGFELVTVGDDRVRPEHERTDGVRRRWNDKFWDVWWPPNGWNCRCQAVAIYDPFTRQTRVPAGLEPDEAFATDFSYLLD